MGGWRKGQPFLSAFDFHRDGYGTVTAVVKKWFTAFKGLFCAPNVMRLGDPDETLVVLKRDQKSDGGGVLPHNTEEGANASCAIDSNVPCFAVEQQEVIQDIQHGEPSAFIPPGEASEIVHEQWATSRELEATSSRPPPGKEIVVFALTKHSKTVEDLLLHSPLAQSLIDEGVDVKPAWAGGAKVFVKSITSSDAAELRATFGQHVGLGPCHVVVEAGDEPKVRAALRPSTKSRAIATIKPGTTMRAQLAGDDEFACSSSSGQLLCVEGQSGTDDENVKAESELKQVFHIVVKRTFIQAEELSRSDNPLKCSHSWP